MKQRTFRFVFVFFMLALIGVSDVFGATKVRKREFRGAWIQCVNGQFQGIGTRTMQNTLRYQLDELQKDGVNAIFFQVRAECDALYPSKIEPWSKFLSGVQGQAPSPYWDPLQWMIDECHKRGMELHAWINPFRARTKSTASLAQNHIARQRPDLVFQYDNLLILNPGNPESRKYIYKVVEDIVGRYDVDGLHIDDYFYPYPAAGQTIPDQREFRTYSNGIKNINDWRRDNVNVFIKELNEVVKKTKPWVKFGVSPFGIYRNKRTDPLNGSDTRGLQNYDDLYADVLFWINNGWIDYCVPQLYWEIGHSAADYKTLITWWNKYCSKRPLFIGEDVDRTAKHPDPQNPSQNQLAAKRRLHDQMPNVKGTVLWYAKATVDNVGGYGTALRNYYWRYPALQPLMPFIDSTKPKKPRKVKALNIDGDHVLFWTAPKGNTWKKQAVKYVVYRFKNGEAINIEDPTKIVKITYDTHYKLPYVDGRQTYTYVVTALNRLSNESKVKKVRVKL